MKGTSGLRSKSDLLTRRNAPRLARPTSWFTTELMVPSLG